MTCNGSERYGAGTLRCSSPGGRLVGLAHALAISCNVAFANLAMKLGRDALLEEFRLWGFDGVRQMPEDELQLARLAIGLDATDMVAMKTGTASAPGLGYHVNYIGVGPLPYPRIAFCVRLTHQPTSPQVTRAAREVTASLLEGLRDRVGRPGG